MDNKIPQYALRNKCVKFAVSYGVGSHMLKKSLLRF